MMVMMMMVKEYCPNVICDEFTRAFTKPVSCSFRYVVCKGLRENSQDVHEYMFNVNVRINRLKKEGTGDVVEVSARWCIVKRYVGSLKHRSQSFMPDGPIKYVNQQ